MSTGRILQKQSFATLTKLSIKAFLTFQGLSVFKTAKVF
ncbi:hypothetical protein RV10_GL002473 [Enterococcus pallens]|nr:hypothetical protein RV10_GL002473 [Enterococcus pallens]